MKSVRLPQAALAWSPALATMALGLPAIIARLSGADLSPEAAVAIFGLGILSAAFLLGAGIDRERELAVRGAIGATRRRMTLSAPAQ